MLTYILFKEQGFNREYRDLKINDETGTYTFFKDKQQRPSRLYTIKFFMNIIEKETGYKISERTAQRVLHTLKHTAKYNKTKLWDSSAMSIAINHYIYTLENGKSMEQKKTAGVNTARLMLKK